MVGIVHSASKAMKKKKMAIKTKEARHPQNRVANPEDMLPNIAPVGLPDPSTPAAILRRLPSGYVAKRVPIAGGEIIAVPSPKKPHSTFIATELFMKYIMRAKRLKDNMPKTS